MGKDISNLEEELTINYRPGPFEVRSQLQVSPRDKVVCEIGAVFFVGLCAITAYFQWEELKTFFS